TVYLRTIPVDPRDIFRGDYVTLSYEISQFDNIPYEYIPFLSSEGHADKISGKQIYVVLEMDSTGIATARYKTLIRPEGEKLYITGTIKEYEQPFAIEYGIESYFVPEGTGKELERIRGRSLFVEVVIDKQGAAVIRGVKTSDELLL
ncbi:hypothetical protein A3B56_01775, partial [Candidatus Roizmanbacteria bacterium RIFCSPLOWO2_01_FULL_45_11]